jgi:hypothetical protein
MHCFLYSDHTWISAVRDRVAASEPELPNQYKRTVIIYKLLVAISCAAIRISAWQEESTPVKFFYYCIQLSFSILVIVKIVIAHLPYSKKSRWAYEISLLSVLCVCVSPPNSWIPEPILMKLGLYIMAPEPISTASFINPYHQYYQHYVPLNFRDQS